MESSVTRVELIAALQRAARARSTDIPRQDCSRFLESTLEAITNALETQDVVKIARFGNFVVREKRKRLGRNPKTGQQVMIKPRRVVTFKPSPILRDRVGAAAAPGLLHPADA